MTHPVLCREWCYSFDAPAYRDFLHSDATIAEYSRAAGYCTLTSGAWHVSGDFEVRSHNGWRPGEIEHARPRRRSFDRSYAILNGTAHCSSLHYKMEDRVSRCAPALHACQATDVLSTILAATGTTPLAELNGHALQPPHTESWNLDSMDDALRRSVYSVLIPKRSSVRSRMHPQSRFRQSFVIRFAEVDQQGVAYNGNYMIYVDETMERWLATFGDFRSELGWDMMTKKFTLEWHGSVTQHDTLDVDVAVIRWGKTSWTLGFLGSSNGEPVFNAEMVYVSVGFGGAVPMETPPKIRECLGPEVDLLGKETG